MNNVTVAILSLVESGLSLDKESSSIYTSCGKKKSQTLNSNGYKVINFRLTTGKVVWVPVHRIVAYFKFGSKIFEKGVVVRHLNNNRLDNTFNNISIGTQRDNIMDNSPENRRLWASSPVHPHKEILEDRKSGMSYSQLMLKYGIKSKGTLSYIINKSYKADDVVGHC